MNNLSFAPTANLESLQYRAEILRKIRDYFYCEGVVEMDVPALGTHSVTDPHLQSLSLDLYGKPHYLQTSPEYYLKRLLAAGSGSIYSLAKAYRADEKGKRHRAEFTLLEWYRIGADDQALISDTQRLLKSVGLKDEDRIVSYRELFIQATGINPHRAQYEELQNYTAENFGADWSGAPVSTCLDLIFSHMIEPQLEQPTFVVDYPACQCALAKIVVNQFGERVAKRFELFWQGIELANGYWELTDAQEQRRRFADDNTERLTLGSQTVAHDPKFLAALDSGLPPCSGIAMGVDRLLMCLQHKTTLSEVMAFADF